MPEERGPWEDYQSPAESSAAPWEGFAQDPQTQPQPAMSRFFSSLGDVLAGFNPLTAVQEFIDRPNVWKAATSVPAAPGPEREQALDRWVATPGVSHPMGSAFPAGVGPALKAGQQVREGDIAGGAGTAFGAYGVAPVVGYGIGKAAPIIGTQAGRQQIATTTRRGLEKLTPRTTTQLMKQAFRPRNEIAFVRNTELALPEINESSLLSGKPIQTMDDMLEAVDTARERVWSQREAIGGNQDLRRIDLSPVGDAIEQSIPEHTLLHYPKRAQAVRNLANNYRGRTFTIQEAEKLLEGVNAKLKAYYEERPAAKFASRMTNPNTAALAAEADWLRKRIYGELDQAGGGEGPRELSRRYGALAQMKEEINRRMPAVTRETAMDLPEHLGKITAARDLLFGPVRMIKDPVGGGLQFAQGVATWQINKALKEAKSINTLIERTFRNYSGRPTPVNVKRVEPRALLGPGPIVTPPPADPSGITVTTGPPLQPRVRGLLPPAPLVTPPPADPSRVWAVPGQPAQPTIRGYLERPPIVTPPPPDPSGITVTTGPPLSLSDLVRLGYLKKKPKKR